MGTDRNDHDERIAAAIRALADGDGQLTSPPTNLWGRIEDAIDDGADASPGLVAPPSDLWDRIAAAARAESVDAAPEPDLPLVRRRAGWGRVVALVAAAVVLLGLVVGAAAFVRRDSGTPTGELIAQASLTGEGIEPGGDGTGSAQLTQTDGRWTVAIDALDLPTPPEGTYYEAWLLGSGAGQVQSLGALDGADGFTVPTGLEIADFPLVDVSIEPIDGDPAHSSLSVLRGRLEEA